MQNADPRSVHAKFREALTLHQQGRLPAAEQAYREILAVQPHHFDALHLLGVIFAQTGRQEAGAELIGRAIDLDPNIAAAHANRAKALNDIGRNEEAIAHCERAIAIDPRDTGAYVNRGNALHALGRYQAAVESYDG